MTSIAIQLHELFNKQPRLSFPFDDNAIPKNGIYVIFEKGEKVGELDRIVRVGTHNGNNQLLSRLKQHFIKENKNRSIFRKNIGRCFLNQENQHYMPFWEMDTTPKEHRERKLKTINDEYEKELEKRISDYVQNHLSFCCVFEVNDKKDRLFWERKLISTVAQSGITPSENWLGNHSPKEKIKSSGLWQVNELNKEILTDDELKALSELLK